MGADAVVEVEWKLTGQLADSLRAIQHEMQETRRITLDSSKGIKSELEALKRKSEESKSAFSEMSKMALKWAAGFVSVQTLVRGISMATQAAREQREANLSLNAVLEATGHAAGMTFAELEQLATAYQKTTKFQDDAVMSAQGMLLQFDRIGKDIFPKALQASVDLASFMGTDLRSAAQAVGQALQDPESAGRKLRAMNIILTEAQQEQIKTFIEQNEAAKAQALIFELLDKKVGDHAKNTVQATELLKNEVGEMLESLGAGFVDAMEGLSKGILKLIPGVDTSKLKADELRQIYDELRKKNPLALPSDLAMEAQKQFAALKKQREETEKLAAARGAAENKARIEKEDKAKADKPKIEKARKAAEEQAKLEEEIRHNALKREADFQNKVRAASLREQKEARDAAVAADEKRTEEIYRAREEAEKNLRELKNRQEEAEAKDNPLRALEVGDGKMAALEADHQRELELFKGTEEEKTALLNAQAAERDQIRRQEVQSSIEAMSGLLGGLAKLTSQANMRDRENRLRYKALAIAEATVNTYLAATKALTVGVPPFNYIAAAGVVAAGLAQVGQIKDQKFASGTLSAPGGMALVGERGPELVQLPRGARVYNNTESQGMMSSSWPKIDVGGINITISGKATREDAEIIGNHVENRLRQLAKDTKMMDYLGVRA